MMSADLSRDTGARPRPTDPHAAYAERLGKRERKSQRCMQRDRMIGTARLLLFLAGCGTAWFFLRPGTVSWGWLLPFGIGFAGLVLFHERVKRQRLRAERSVAFYTQGLARLEDRWAGSPTLGEPGTEFLQESQRDGHPYAADLDLFGPGSVFALLCTARTSSGRQTLAAWLTTPAPPEEIRARQAAIDELCLRLDLREELAIRSDAIDAGVSPHTLQDWGQSLLRLSGRWLPVIAGVLSFLSLMSLAAWGLTAIGPVPFVVASVVQCLFAARVRQRVCQAIINIERVGRELSLLSEVLLCLEQESFSCPWLVRLQAMIATNGLPPSRQIARLNRLITLLESRKNQLFGPLAALLLWTTQIACGIERWRAGSGQSIAQWLSAIGQFEALNALAGYAYEHPADPFPELVLQQKDGKRIACFEGTGLGHPLLPEQHCVRNDVGLNQCPQALIVSGSNMSGKSTLLRTVGVNAVLALAGAPVRARHLRLSPLTLGANLRVQDSLHAGTSRFYAEVIRVRQLMDVAVGPVPLLFLLDEIFHGTNSHDRQIGAASVVRGLLERDAIGLVTTHDLALAQIAEALAPRVVNVCFEDQFEDGELRFDYRMKTGVVQRSNALALMQSVGLEVS